MRRHPLKLRLQTKLIIGLVLMAVVLTACLVPAIASLYRSRMEEYYVKIAFDQATIASQYIDGDSIARYYEDGIKDDYYRTVHDYLLQVKETVGLQYFYVVVPEEDVMVYIWDVGEEGEDGVCELGDSDAYYGGGHELMHAAFAADAPKTILVTNNEEYGYLASAYVAILDSRGQPAALASVDISMDLINQQIRQFVLLTVLVTCAVLAACVLTYCLYIRRCIVRPLGALHQAASNLVKNNISHVEDFSIRIRTGDEIQELAEAFQYMTVELAAYIRDLAHITAEKERIGAELNVATQIQRDMLPNIFPAFPDRAEFDIYATMDPAKEVGGDFYDFFMVDDTHLAVVMADVSGKGVPAALFMVIAKTILKNQALTGESLDQVFIQTNDQLCENNGEGLFVTVFMGLLDLVHGGFDYVNAGHNPPALRPAGGTYHWLNTLPGFVMAGMEHTRYKLCHMDLSPGDTLFLYTDGVTEAQNGSEELWGEERLLAVLNAEAARDLRPARLLPYVRDDLDRFVQGAEQFDDITMLALEYKGPAQPAGRDKEGRHE